MSEIRNDNYNRLEINPLVEENMNQMQDSEFSVSQLTGHITLKKEDKFLSKTKELEEASIDLEKFNSNLNNRYLNYKNTEDIKNRVNRIESTLNETKEKIDRMYSKLEEYEKISKKIDIDINETDNYIINELLPKVTEKYSESMSSCLKKLGNLLIQYENLDIIIDNEEYFENFVKDVFKYLDKEGNIKDYGIVELHEENKKEMDLRVNKSDYESYVKSLENRYKAIANKYGLSGSYKITGWS